MGVDIRDIIHELKKNSTLKVTISPETFDEGTYGELRNISFKHNDENICGALKIIKRLEEKTKENYELEIEIAKKMADLNIGPYIYYSYIGKNNVYIIMDKYNGSLLDLFAKNEKKDFSSIIQKAIDLLKIQYFKYNILCRDIKLDNFVYKTNDPIKCDMFKSNINNKSIKDVNDTIVRMIDFDMCHNIVSEDKEQDKEYKYVLNLLQLFIEVKAITKNPKNLKPFYQDEYFAKFRNNKKNKQILYDLLNNNNIENRNSLYLLSLNEKFVDFIYDNRNIKTLDNIPDYIKSITDKDLNILLSNVIDSINQNEYKCSAFPSEFCSYKRNLLGIPTSIPTSIPMSIPISVSIILALLGIAYYTNKKEKRKTRRSKRKSPKFSL
jgi:hypothetical protein